VPQDVERLAHALEGRSLSVLGQVTEVRHEDDVVAGFVSVPFSSGKSKSWAIRTVRMANHQRPNNE
jgi:hypothetical protein